jgi:predicted Na+-dependent transporter
MISALYFRQAYCPGGYYLIVDYWVVDFSVYQLFDYFFDLVSGLALLLVVFGRFSDLVSDLVLLLVVFGYFSDLVFDLVLLLVVFGCFSDLVFGRFFGFR